MKANQIQSSMNAGEISPKLYGRVDQQDYFNAVAGMENFYVKATGGAFSRPGLRFVHEVKTSSKYTRLYPFQFSVLQAYMIEVGDLYMRFYKDGGIIESSPGVPVEIVTPYLESELFELQAAQDADTLYIVHKSHPVYKLTRSSHTAWTLTQVVFSNGPYLDQNITNVVLTPSATTGTITLTASNPAWAGGTDYIPGDYVTESATVYICLIPHVSGTFATDLAAGKWKAQALTIFVDTAAAGHIGSIWEIGETTPGWVEITGWTSATVATALVHKTIPAGGTTYWKEGAFSGYRGYPGCVQFYEQRLALASSEYKPQTVWLSRSQSYEDMTVETDLTSASIGSSALIYTIASEEVNAINFMSAGKVLLLGTEGGPFSLSSGAANEALTPMNVLVKKEATYGCAPILPTRIGNNLYYVQRNLRTIREVEYSLLIDAYQSLDATIRSDEITYSGIVEADYQQSPNNIIWYVREDGQMCAVTRQIEQKVMGWHRHTTDGLFESVGVIPSTDIQEDTVWVIVNRTIGGATKRYVEYMELEQVEQQEDCFFVDSGLSYNGRDEGKVIISVTATNPPIVGITSHGFNDGDVIRIRNVVGMTEINQKKFTVANKTTHTFELLGVDGSAYTAYISGGTARKCAATVSGLSHLEGEQVTILADGAPHPLRTVSSGSITLDDSYSEVHVGLVYTPKLKLLNLEGYTRLGSAVGIVRRIIRTTLMLYKSLGFSVGLEDAEDITFYRTPANLMNNPIPLFTGQKQFPFPGGWGKERQMVIIQEQPLPCNILSITNLCHVGDE